MSVPTALTTPALMLLLPALAFAVPAFKPAPPTGATAPTVVVDTKVYSPVDGRVLVSAKQGIFTDNHKRIVVKGKNGRVVDLSLEVFVITPHLISVRLIDDQDTGGRRLIVEPGKQVTIVLPGKERLLLDLEARLL